MGFIERPGRIPNGQSGQEDCLHIDRKKSYEVKRGLSTILGILTLEKIYNSGIISKILHSIDKFH